MDEPQVTQRQSKINFTDHMRRKTMPRHPVHEHDMEKLTTVFKCRSHSRQQEPAKRVENDFISEIIMLKVKFIRFVRIRPAKI